MTVLVDTDVLVWWLRGKPSATERIARLPLLTLSIVSRMELVQGCRNAQELHLLNRELEARRAVVLPLIASIADAALDLMHQHTLKDGLRISDAMIAATALHHGLTALTGNYKHFAPISGLNVERYSA